MKALTILTAALFLSLPTVKVQAQGLGQIDKTNHDPILNQKEEQLFCAGKLGEENKTKKVSSLDELIMQWQLDKTAEKNSSKKKN